MLRTFEDNEQALRRFIARYLPGPQDIEDVAQEAFLRAYRAELDTDIRQPKSFIFRIAKNVAVSQLRLKYRHLTDSIEDLPPSNTLIAGSTVEEEVWARQKLLIHCDAVATLPPQCRRVYLMRKVHGMSYKDISERLGISISTIEKHLVKGVKVCDRYIRDMTDGDEEIGRSANLDN